MVSLCEVGPRDGLQNEPRVLAPPLRAELIRRLAACGLQRIEAVSFVREDRVPQMAGAEDVLALIGPRLLARCAALVLNEQGMRRALAARVPEVNVAIMATDGFAKANTGMSVEDALVQLRAAVALARAAQARITGTVSVAFGCQYDGRVEQSRVMALAAELVGAGVDQIVLADTIGVATPSSVRGLVRSAVRLDVPIGVHFHDTRNTAIANCLAALEAGATIFESAVGGLGGCPFSPGATGNLATEDLVYVLEAEGVRTGVDLSELLSVSAWLESTLGRKVPSALAAAGPWRPAA
jgi:isopropylmalate/homocitrate/citramalate synthase